MHEQEQLQNKAANVARLAPREWGEFVVSLQAYVEVQRSNLVKSPLQELPVNQGRAQLGTTLALLLRDCVANDDTTRKGKKP